jgi:hypothetical protein
MISMITTLFTTGVKYASDANSAKNAREASEVAANTKRADDQARQIVGTIPPPGGTDQGQDGETAKV